MEQIDLFDKPGEGGEGGEDESKMIEGRDMTENDNRKDFVDKEFNERIKNAKAKTKSDLLKELGYKPWVPAGEEKPIDPKRKEWLEMVKKRREEDK